MGWTMSGEKDADFYLMNITTNAPQTPYSGILNITTASDTQYELNGFLVGYEYIITLYSVIVKHNGLKWSSSEPLTIRLQGRHVCTKCMFLRVA